MTNWFCKFRKFFAIIVCATPSFIALHANAEDTLTAGKVLDLMPSNELGAYVQGIVEGLAQARYERDDRDTSGMECIFEWFYSAEDGAGRAVVDAFAQYPDHFPGAILSGLIQKECPG